MKRPRIMSFTKVGATLLSTVVFAACAALWLRSAHVRDSVSYHSYREDVMFGESIRLTASSYHAAIALEVERARQVTPPPTDGGKVRRTITWTASRSPRGDELAVRHNAPPGTAPSRWSFMADAGEKVLRILGAGEAYAPGWARPPRPYVVKHRVQVETKYWKVVLPIWMPLLVSALLPGAAASARFRTRRLAKCGRCVTCGYDLRASTGRCPECGTLHCSISPVQGATPR